MWHVVTNGETMLEIADPETSQMSNCYTKEAETWQQSEQLNGALGRANVGRTKHKPIPKAARGCLLLSPLAFCHMQSRGDIYSMGRHA